MSDATSTARAHWEGPLIGGTGTTSTASPALDSAHMTWKARTGGEFGTTPEELLGAAHATCYSMALSGAIAKAGFDPDRVDVVAKVTFGPGDTGNEVKSIALTVEAVVPGIDEATFLQLADDTKMGCPISKALAGGTAAITIDAKLLQPA
jgi:osmotically inducible protein OsmC